MKKNVFISYSRKDEILISKFRQEERGREFEILIDDEEIVLNEAWQDTIIKKINDSNGAILFISKNALKKDSPIRTLELPLIAKKLKDKKDDFHFFPIFAEDIEQKLLEKYSFTPEGFSKEVNFLDFFQLLPGDRQPLSNLSKRKQRLEFQYINADISELLKGNTLSPGREKIKRERFRRKMLYYLLGFILLFVVALTTRQFINTYIDNALESNPNNIASEDSSTIQFLVEQIDRLENQISILGEDDELSENSTSTTSSTILKNEDDSTSTDNQSTSTTTTTVAPVKTTTTLATTTTVAPNVTTTNTLATLDAEENVADNLRPSRTTSRLTITNVTSNSLTLSWDPFQDNVGIKEYKIFNNDILIGSTTLTNFNVTGLTPGSFNSFEVYGYDLTENTSSNNVSNSIYTMGTTTTSTTTMLLQLHYYYNYIYNTHYNLNLFYIVLKMQ